MQKQDKVLLEKRERFDQTPDRYTQVPLIDSVQKLFANSGVEWRTKHKEISYVDLGSGNCRGTRIFADFIEKSTQLPVNAVGIDASTACAGQCREKGIEYRQVNFGEEEIPVKDFQVATLFETIEHVYNTDYLLESVRKTIANDGLLLVTTLNVVCLKNRILVPLGIQPFNTEVSTKKLSYGYKTKQLKNKMDTWPPAGHIRPFTLHSLCDMLEDNRFKIVKTYGLESWRSLKFLEHIAKNMCTGMLVVAKPA
jgi:2-polyprenyl-3-methyl-5-hydroxy-6-metoxy-1,4-benzoquinol methylase